MVKKVSASNTLSWTEKEFLIYLSGNGYKAISKALEPKWDIFGTVANPPRNGCLTKNTPGAQQ